MLIFALFSLFLPGIAAQGNSDTYERYYNKLEPNIVNFVDEIKEKPLVRKFLQQAIPILFDVSKPPIHRKIGIESLAEKLDANITTAYEDLGSKIQEILKTSVEIRSRLRFVVSGPIWKSFWPELEGALMCFIVKDEFIDSTAEEKRKQMFIFLENEELFRELDILAVALGKELREQPAWFSEFARRSLGLDVSQPYKEREEAFFEIAREYFTEDKIRKITNGAKLMDKTIIFLTKFFPKDQKTVLELTKTLSMFAEKDFMDKTREEQQEWLKRQLVKYRTM